LTDLFWKMLIFHSYEPFFYWTWAKKGPKDAPSLDPLGISLGDVWMPRLVLTPWGCVWLWACHQHPPAELSGQSWQLLMLNWKENMLYADKWNLKSGVWFSTRPSGDVLPVLICHDPRISTCFVLFFCSYACQCFMEATKHKTLAQFRAPHHKVWVNTIYPRWSPFWKGGKGIGDLPRASKYAQVDSGCLSSWLELPVRHIPGMEIEMWTV
jgi:hypothetical protein